MPTCDPILITPIIQEVLYQQPKTVLEIGTGTGKFGALVREYTDIWYRRLHQQDWRTRIHGIEIFSGYRNPLWGLYDSVMIGDATKLIDMPQLLLPCYDLILMTEVLEHLSKETGKMMLAKCLQKANIFIFSFTNSPQDAAFGNEHERHISQWNESDLNIEATCLLQNGTTFLYKASIKH